MQISPQHCREEKGIQDIALFGTSQGAASVLIAASQDKTLAPVIAENSFADIQSLISDSIYDGQSSAIPGWIAIPSATLTWYRNGGSDTPSPLEAADNIHQAVFLMHSYADKLIAAYHSQLIFKALNGPKQQWYLDEASHSLLFNDNPELYKAKVISFLDEYFTVPRSLTSTLSGEFN